MTESLYDLVGRVLARADKFGRELTDDERHDGNDVLTSVLCYLCDRVADGTVDRAALTLVHDHLRAYQASEGIGTIQQRAAFFRSKWQQSTRASA